MRLDRLLRAALLAAGALLLTGGTVEDQLKCEEAAKHLADCCPATYAFTCEAGCMSAPDIPLEAAECILSLECAQIETQGLCAYPRVTPACGR